MEWCVQITKRWENKVVLISNLIKCWFRELQFQAKFAMFNISRKLYKISGS